MTSLTYEHITKHAERKIRNAMQRAAACDIGISGLGIALGEARGALAPREALVTTIDAVDPVNVRADRTRFEALAYAMRPAIV
ncbi:hypothetical protein K7N18_25400 [Burkholderia arboris]|uniref:hypothetical protein n=1 Tax=Burkholderia arboris TaxID=488730 RepID=UPI001CA3F9D9|nr:hypothetical protein [Burkholderia arboris]MBY8608166.1 hypothetical protein [Burkholderia arboris]